MFLSVRQTTDTTEKLRIPGKRGGLRLYAGVGFAIAIGVEGRKKIRIRRKLRMESD